jgi:hypothetical protein
MTSEQFNWQVDGMYFHQQRRAAMTRELQLAYLELEIDGCNLDVYQARAEAVSLDANIEQDKLRKARAANDEKRAKLNIRRLQEEIVQLKQDQTPVAQAEPVVESCVLSKQAYEDLKLVLESIGSENLTNLSTHMSHLMQCWYNILSCVLCPDDADTEKLPQSRRALVKGTIIK